MRLTDGQLQLSALPAYTAAPESALVLALRELIERRANEAHLSPPRNPQPD